MKDIDELLRYFKSLKDRSGKLKECL